MGVQAAMGAPHRQKDQKQELYSVSDPECIVPVISERGSKLKA